MLWMSLRPPVAVEHTVEPRAVVDKDRVPAAYVRPVSQPIDPEEASSLNKAKALCSTTLHGAQPRVAQVGHLLQNAFGIADIGAAEGRGDGDHAAGLALDLMMPDSSLGDVVADFVLANKERFGVTYVIWKQRYNDGAGWSFMEDRGSPTANHYDHVHVSFEAGGRANFSC
ncbi:hypothetical protein [Nocardia camponoti]|nr:hypothetical protein [Nocardia camponoti]